MTTAPAFDLGPDRLLDVREVPCSLKHGRIFQTCRELPLGDHFLLRNGHEPAPLRAQLEAQYPGAFRWECVHRAADDVTMKITKLRPTSGDGDVSACGEH